MQAEAAMNAPAYMSPHMIELQKIVLSDSTKNFHKLGTNHEVKDTDECLMLMYVDILSMNSVPVYNNIL